MFVRVEVTVRVVELCSIFTSPLGWDLDARHFRLLRSSIFDPNPTVRSWYCPQTNNVTGEDEQANWSPHVPRGRQDPLFCAILVALPPVFLFKFHFSLPTPLPTTRQEPLRHILIFHQYTQSLHVNYTGTRFKNVQPAQGSVPHLPQGYWSYLPVPYPW